jgi:hypothetical protein
MRTPELVISSEPTPDEVQYLEDHSPRRRRCPAPARRAQPPIQRAARAQRDRARPLAVALTIQTQLVIQSAGHVAGKHRIGRDR